ncbi:glutamine synthetase beta-grasp domain-containing protein [Streptomyces sp. KL116D]|uniref:glutamine synthetase beta-grasp domain-containing protein n=1 Tax=Streptomyces sp. KL116D TaxID=3045152 RepID=UPI003557A31E
MFQNADDAKKFIADEDVKLVDVRFCDLPGVMQHFTVPAAAFDPTEELAFDGSSIRVLCRPSTSPTWRCARTSPPPAWTPSAATRR